MSGKVELLQEEGVARLYLHHPGGYNVIDESLLMDLQRSLEALEQNEQARVLIITGAGEKAFSTGFDLKWMSRLSPVEIRKGIARVHRILDFLENFPLPTVAALNGLTIGGGLILSLVCDFRIASAGAVLGIPEVKVGFAPVLGAARRLQRTVGLPKAKELIMLGHLIDAGEAERIGLVNKVVPPERLMEEARRYAYTLMEGAPLAQQVAKKNLNLSWRVDPQALGEFEGEMHAFQWGTADLAEGASAFMEKRKPEFKGR